MSPSQPTAVDPIHVFLHAAYFDLSARHLEGIGREYLASMPSTQRAVKVIAPGLAESTIADITLLPPTWIPMMVNGMLSVEMYLKAVVFHEKNGILPKRTHDLSDLFSEISSPERAKIETLYGEALSLDITTQAKRAASHHPELWDLVPLLQRHDRAFKEIRYSYEQPLDWEYESLIAVRNALYSYGVQLSPTWKEAVQKVGILPT